MVVPTEAEAEAVDDDTDADLGEVEEEEERASNSAFNRCNVSRINVGVSWVAIVETP